MIERDIYANWKFYSKRRTLLSVGCVRPWLLDQIFEVKNEKNRVCKDSILALKLKRTGIKVKTEFLIWRLRHAFSFTAVTTFSFAAETHLIIWRFKDIFSYDGWDTLIPYDAWDTSSYLGAKSQLLICERDLLIKMRFTYPIWRLRFTYPTWRLINYEWWYMTKMLMFM